MFADDLLLFCKGDAGSIMVLLRAFSRFSNSSGVTMNASKTDVFFNGVKKTLKDDILKVAGVVEGSLLFRYLGVHIQDGRLKKEDYGILVEKIVSRIRGIGFRKLSYAARLVLINAVLSSLHSYWASIFIIPKGVIRRIESICWSFLWDGGSEYHRVPLMAWHKVCRPYKEGGLGVKDASAWNRAAIAKLVSWIYAKSNRLWVLWIHHLYLKGKDWHSYQPSDSDGWAWRRICRVKNEFREAFSSGDWAIRPYTYAIHEGYDWIRLKGAVVSWYEHVWCAWSIPKHSLVAWLIINEALNTREKHYRLVICSSNKCCFCEDQTETINPLLWACAYSSQVKKLVQVWLRCAQTVTRGKQRSLTQRNVEALICNAFTYHIWLQRNQCRILLFIDCLEKVFNCIKQDVRARIKVKLREPVA
ncbi:hypothetical protein RND81_05G023600 [Saponaria officinalis]|uniref:Reverse transcriptase domain-containing protein n=1 Tax=Saponaria officinalis TaxID=3572 RepID=A0AAW1KPY7_SAPOF